MKRIMPVIHACLMLVACDQITTPPSTIDATINVDLSSSIVPVKSMIGFLHGMDSINPHDSLIYPLSPKYWRAGTLMPHIDHRIGPLGSIPIITIGDIYRYPGDNVPGWQQPFIDSVGWKTLCANIHSLAQSAGQRVIIDIWGEPNGSAFSWTGTHQDFFNTFRMAVDTIRSMPGGDTAWICGPTAGTLDTSFIIPFMDFCVTNNLTFQVLNWHEFRSGPAVHNISDQIPLIRSYTQSPPYNAIGIERILITEFIPYGIYNNPGAILTYFDELEEGGADGGCKACWDESPSVKNCWNSSLDGILTNGSLEKRAAWWAYYYYNISTVSRFSGSSTSDVDLVCFSSCNSENPDEVQILIGNYGSNKTVNQLDINLSGISSVPFLSTSSLNLRVLKIAPTGEAPMYQPQEIALTSIPVNANISQYTIYGLNPGEVIVVQGN